MAESNLVFHLKYDNPVSERTLYFPQRAAVDNVVTPDPNNPLWRRVERDEEIGKSWRGHVGTFIARELDKDSMRTQTSMITAGRKLTTNPSPSSLQSLAYQRFCETIAQIWSVLRLISSLASQQDTPYGRNGVPPTPCARILTYMAGVRTSHSIVVTHSLL